MPAVEFMSDRPVRIYGLFDPRQPSAIRYVGKTLFPLKNRVSEHISHRKRRISSPKNCWIEHLAKDGLRPGVTLIDLCSESQWEDREAFWIGYFRGGEKRLLNVTDGGDTGPCMKGYRHTPESRAKISEAGRGRKASAYSIERTRERNRERVCTPEIRAKLSAYGKTRTDWHKGLEAARKANLGRPCSEETKRKISAAQKGKPRSNYNGSRTT